MGENAKAAGAGGSLPTYAYLLWLPVVIGVIVRFAFPDSFNYSIWSDRDLLRAYRILENFPVEGAEINGAYYARVPGGSYYYLLSVFQLVAKHPIAIYLQISVMITAGFVAVYKTGQETVGAIGALAATGAYALSPGVLSSAAQIWNPALTLPLTAVVFLLFVRVLKGQSQALPWVIGLLIVTIQVHMSNMALLVAVLTVLAIVPHGARRKHWVQALIAAVVVMVPYLAAELANGWVNTKLILAGYDGLIFSAPSPESLLRAQIKIAGGGALGNDGLLQKGLTGLASVLMIGAAWRTLLAFFRCRFGTALFLWHRHLAEADKTERLIVCLGLVVLICSALLTVNRNATVYVRYILFLIPPITLLCGAFLAEVLTRLKARRFAAFTVVGLFCALFTIHGVQYGYSAQGKVNQLPSVTTLIEVLRDKAGFGDEELREKVLLVGSDGRFHFLQAGYLIDIGSRPQSETAYGGCVLAVTASKNRKALALAEKAFKAQAMDMPNLARLFRAGEIHVFGYNLPDGNCYASLFNAYDRSSREREIHLACNAAESDGVLTVRKPGASSGNRFVIRQTFSPSRLCLGIDLNLESGNNEAILFSSHLRGYTGYPISAYRLAEAYLTLEEHEGRSHEVSLLRNSIGGQGNVRTTPWRSELVVPRDGVYRVIFRARLTGAGQGRGGEKNMEEILLENLTLTSEGKKP